MPRDVARGLSSVKRFVREHRIGGVHGTLIELFQCAPQLYTAVEVRCVGSALHLSCVTHESALGTPIFVGVLLSSSSNVRVLCTCMHAWFILCLFIPALPARGFRER